MDSKGMDVRTSEAGVRSDLVKDSERVADLRGSGRFKRDIPSLFEQSKASLMRRALTAGLIAGLLFLEPGVFLSDLQDRAGLNYKGKYYGREDGKNSDIILTQSFETPIGIPIPQDPKKSKEEASGSLEQISDLTPLEKFAFNGMSNEEVKIAREKIDEQKRILLRKTNNDQTHANIEKKWHEKVSNVVAKYAANPANGIAQEDVENWINLTLGIIQIESEGKEWAEAGGLIPNPIENPSPNIAQGLMQLKKSSLGDIEDELHQTEYNLKNPDDNLRFGIAYLLYLDDKYGKLGSLWGYHMGEGNLQTAVVKRAKSDLRMKIDDITGILHSSDNNETGLTKLVRVTRSNYVNILTPAVTGELKAREQHYSSTEIYPFLALAAAETFVK